MPDIRSSAAYRIAFTCSAAFALAIVLLGVAVYFAADASFRRQQDISIVKESAEIVRSYRSEGFDELLEAITVRAGSHVADHFVYALFDRAGRRIAGQLDTPRPWPGWHNIKFRDPREGMDPARALATPLSDGRTLVVAVDTDVLEQINRTILALFAGAFVLVAIIGVAGALILGSYLQRRLERISGTARAIVGGDLGRRVPVGLRGDEFDRLGETLNAMLDRIVQLLENLKQVSGDVAHDLRTPLARLRGGLETAMNGADGLEGHRAAIAHALVQSDQLLSLFGAILRISEVEGGALAAEFAPVDLSGLIADLCDSYAPAVSDGGRDLRCAITPGIQVRGDRELMAQAVINLLDNAQRHTPLGTDIIVTLEAEGSRARVSVADNGPGVAAEDRGRIVRRFVRLESSRSTPGHGLGLNLVSVIAAAHDGELLVGDNLPGLKATITLPRLDR